jgi:hypothetical protein
MIEKQSIGWVAGALIWILLAGLLSGCGQAGRPLPKSNPQAFDSASAEIKTQWDAIQAAAATNGYAAAITGCRTLLKNQSLTPDQRSTVNATQTAVQQKLFDAATKGDAAARADLETLRSVPR